MVSLTDPVGNAFINKYAEELIANARAIAAPGKGILAADESTGTIGKRVSRTPILDNGCMVHIWAFSLDISDGGRRPWITI